METLPKSEIKAITKLLKSNDEETFKLLEEQFKTFDTKTFEEINNEISPDDIELKRNFLEFAFKIKRAQLKNDFNKWSKNHSSDLEDGVFLVAAFANPLLDTEHYSKLLNSWANSISQNLKKVKLKDDPTSVINEINHFVFMELGFKGNKNNFYDPENSFIDKVMEKRLGNPILLSMIYLLITKRIGLSFSGVNMPAHFLVQYRDAFEPIIVDPFNQGEIVTKSVCQERIKALKLIWQGDYLSCPTNKQIILRMMQNLINIYQNNEEFDLKEYLEDYVNIIKRSL